MWVRGRPECRGVDDIEVKEFGEFGRVLKSRSKQRVSSEEWFLVQRKRFQREEWVGGGREEPRVEGGGNVVGCPGEPGPRGDGKGSLRVSGSGPENRTESGHSG